jgi:hypothetical protein
MRRRRWALPASLMLATAWFSAVAVADQAEQLRPIDLRVVGGQENWHADNDFRLDWDRPPVADHGFPVTAVDYRVRDSAGAAVIPETHLPWDVSQIENIHLPPPARGTSPVPGVYVADVWLEGPGGARGPRASATLRFDDVRPGSAQPQAPNAWVAGNASALVRIGHPTGPDPVSGLRGYAISVDRGAGGAPCAGQDRCAVAETDLLAGAGDTISLGFLPEGVNVVRAVAVSGSGMRSAEIRSTIVRVDATKPEVMLRGAFPGWADGPVQVSALARDPLSGMAASDPSGAFTAIAIDGGVPKVAEGEAVAASVTGEGTHAIAFYARDAAGNNGAASAPLATVRIDESPPRVNFANRQDPAEPERIEAVVSDLLSGPDPALGSIALRPAGSRQRFEPLPTSASAGRLVARWNSDAYGAGSYEFRATGYDGAGNVANADRRANGTRMVLANPLKARTAIEAGFSGGRASSRRCVHRRAGHRRCRRATSESYESGSAGEAVPYGQAIAFAGRLSLASGPRLGGLPVQIVETFGAGSDLSRRTSVVQTAPDGTFLARLAPGPSRAVEALFAGNRVLGRSSAEAERVEVLGGVRLHASAAAARVGGAPVIFSGRVGALGAPIPSGGQAVELQFRLAGGTWSEFRTVRTDAHGRFRYPYAFSDDDSRGVRFQFRAFAPGEEDWPYEPAGSKPVFVTGR